MTRRLLDLFCGAGGAAMGYHRAGFEVVGVDIKPQPHYPFEFFQKDAFEALVVLGPHFDAIHASPPCQAYSVGRHIHNSGSSHPDLVSKCREHLEATGRPWVIENVYGAPLRTSAMLCGLMFDLKVLRHRYFETSFGLLAPSHPKHPAGNLTNSNHGYSGRGTCMVCVAGHNFVRQVAASAMGIDWMKSRHELSQAIPPAYTEFVGRQLMKCLSQS